MENVETQKNRENDGYEVGYGKPPKEHQFKPGQVANPLGRPKGQTLKEYVRAWISDMSEEEKQEFLRSMPKETIWKMAEGMPASEQTTNVNVVIPLLAGDSHKKVIDGELVDEDHFIDQE